jgi:hypothetical protein
MRLKTGWLSLNLRWWRSSTTRSGSLTRSLWRKRRLAHPDPGTRAWGSLSKSSAQSWQRQDGAVNAVADLFSSGKVWAPDTRWAREVIEEMAAFPVGEHDDYVDTTTQALLRFRQGGFISLDTDEKDDLYHLSPQKIRILLGTHMATNIDKALYQQPMGIDALGEQESPLRSRSLIPKKSPLAWTGWRSPSARRRRRGRRL